MAASADRVLPSRPGRGLDARGPRAESLKVRPPLIAAAILAAIASIIAFGVGRLAGEMRDFEVYWTAAARALEAGPLYRAGDGHFQFKYLPAFAVLTAPVALLSLEAAKAAWFVASAALLPILIWLALAILPHRHRPGWVLGLAVIVVMGKFYGHELVLGQVNILFGVIATTAVLLLRYGHDVTAAALFVAAIAVKPYAIIFLPWLALARGRRATIASLIGVAVLLALPAIVYGPSQTVALHADWWRTVSESTAPNLTNNDNVSVAGMFAKWIGAGPAASMLTLGLTAVLLLGAALAILRGRAIRDHEALEGALLLTLIPLLSPQGWDYVFLVATPAVALFANYDRDLPGILRWPTWLALFVIGLSLYDLLGRERYASFMSWSVITVCFILLVVSLGVLRERRSA